MTKDEFFTGVLLIVGPRPDSYGTLYRDHCIQGSPKPDVPDDAALEEWCAKVEVLMVAEAAKEVKWTHQLSSVPWRLRRREFEQWCRRQCHEHS